MRTFCTLKQTSSKIKKFLAIIVLDNSLISTAELVRYSRFCAGNLTDLIMLGITKWNSHAPKLVVNHAPEPADGSHQDRKLLIHEFCQNTVVGEEVKTITFNTSIMNMLGLGKLRNKPCHKCIDFWKHRHRVNFPSHRHGYRLK